jgi:hypothetical protein
MACNFLKVNREQPYLMPPSLRDWLPKGDLAWFLLDAVEQMDLKGLYEAYRSDGWGHPAFEPKMMATLLMYAYSVGERSIRRIERLCERDIAFRVVTANQKPDHTVIRAKDCRSRAAGWRASWGGRQSSAELRQNVCATGSIGAKYNTVRHEYCASRRAEPSGDTSALARVKRPGKFRKNSSSHKF